MKHKNINKKGGFKLPIKNTTIIFNKNKIFKNGKIVFENLFVLKNKSNVFKRNYIFQYKSCVFKLNKSHSSPSVFKIGVFGIIIGFINGFFGGGGGMVCVPLLTNVFKLKEKSAHATAIFIMLPLSVSSLVVYFLKGTLNTTSVPVVILGFAAGALAGAILLNKINNLTLKFIFSLIILAAGVRMLFN